MYDLDNILNDSFSYFNIEEQRFGIIKIKNGNVYKDDKIKEKRTATYKEITMIRKIKQLEQTKIQKQNK